MRRGDARRPAAGPRRLWEDRRGVVLVEFAFVSIALMTLVMGILHIGFCLYVQSVLDHAATEIAIRIETTGNDPKAVGFQATTVCPATGGLLDCSKIRFTLFPVPNFRDPSAASTPNSAGSSRSLMLLKLNYDVPIPTWPVLALTGGGPLTVSAAVPFVNEF